MLTFEGMENLCAWNRDTLDALAESADTSYRRVWVPKKSGGFRPAVEPDVLLKGAQAFLAEVLLVPRINSPIGFGFGHREMIAGAKLHARRRPTFLRTADIIDFFPSVITEHVRLLLREQLGFEDSLAEVLARIFTYRGELPQGAPSSPAIASLILEDVDAASYAEAKRFDLRLTRWCDDFAISGADSSTILHLRDVIAYELSKLGLAVHPDKDRIKDQRGPMVMLGLDISHGRVRVPALYRQQVERDVYTAAKFGADPKRWRSCGDKSAGSRAPARNHRRKSCTRS